MFLLLLMLEPFLFYLQKMKQKIIFSKNKLSGDIGLMIQIFHLNFFAAAVSNYCETLLMLEPFVLSSENDAKNI